MNFISIILNRNATQRGLEGIIASVITKLAESAPDIFRHLQQEPKSGVPGPVNQRSAPGEVPASQSGNLGDKIETKLINNLHGQVRWTAKYASYLNDGTPKMAARPFLERTAEGVLAEARRSGLLGARR